MKHRLTPVQKRVLTFMDAPGQQPVRFEMGHKNTTLEGCVVRCQSLVWYFLKANGYIHEPNPHTNAWELTVKGITAIGRKRLTHDEAAKFDHYCPMCRMISYDLQPGVYTCVTCGDEGYDCCIAGRGTECPNCAEERDKRREFDS